MLVTSFVENGAIYALTGAFAGLMSGILGIGGGMIVVPALVYIFHHTHVIPNSLEMHIASGTSFAIMIMTTQASVRAHHRKEPLLWSIYNLLWPAIVLGAISGVFLASYLSSDWLKMLLGVVLLCVAVKMLLNLNISKPRHFPPTWINRLIGFLIGVKSGLLGIGGGAVIVPYLSYCGVDTRRIPGVSALCTLTVASIGTIAVIIAGYHFPELPAYSTGFIYWPAVFGVAIPSMFFVPVGARLTYILPVQELKKAFVAILFFAGISLIF